MKNNFILLISILAAHISLAQSSLSPEKIYGRLFTDVQMNKIFFDSKTFADAVPKRSPKTIVADYLSIIHNPAIRFSLKLFIEENFILPSDSTNAIETQTGEDIKTHINHVWDALERKPDSYLSGNSLLPLPNNYIVSGGRFREAYYEDSYFIMLGLQESGRNEMLENTVKNFAYLLSQYGYIPTANRTYYLNRSQAPFFSMMLDLLAEKKGKMVYALYQNVLQKEYDYWMDKTIAKNHVVLMPDGSKLNRYYNRDTRPRAESFYEDSTLAINYAEERKSLYRNLRSCTESGWGLSTRWFADGENISTIQVTNLISVDLNCLLYHLERTLARSYKETGDLLKMNYYNQIAEKRKNAINKYCFNKNDSWYYDYNISEKNFSTEKTLAGITPLFFTVTTESSAKEIVAVLQKDFLKPGGLITTLKTTGHKWDAPFGHAPLQYMAIKGLENYGDQELAKDIAIRWTQLNLKVYKTTGNLLEKYNVTEIAANEKNGGEHALQDRFACTNGVLLKLMNTYDIKE